MTLRSRFLPPRAASFALALALAFPAPAAEDDEKAAVDRWVQELSSKDAAKRRAAISALAAAGAGQAPRLARLVGSAEDDLSRHGALEALSRNEMAYAYSHVFWDALPPAEERKERAQDRLVAWDCLVRVGDAFLGVGEFGAASDHYCDLLESAASSRERAVAILGLGRASRRRAAEEVFRALDDEDSTVRRAALAAATKLRWGQALPYLRRQLDDGSPERVVELLEALSRRADAPAAEMAQRLTDHAKPAVRDAARRARARQQGFVTEWWVARPTSSERPRLAAGDVLKIAGAGLALPSLRADAKLESGGILWRRERAQLADGEVDLSAYASGPGSEVFACCEFVTDRACRARLRLRPKGKVACWLDGKRIGDPDGGTTALAAGLHRVVVCVRPVTERWTLSLRWVDESGKPLLLAPRMLVLSPARADAESRKRGQLER